MMAYLVSYEDVANKIKEKEKKTDVELIKKRLHEFCIEAESQIGTPCLKLVSKILVRAGPPVEEILNVVEKEKCDMITL
jgi:nucleotide-binding universal stress UspA family protein